MDATVTNLAELSSEVVGQPYAYHRGSLRPEVNKLFVTFPLPFTLFELSLPCPWTWCDGALLTQTALCREHLVIIHSLNPTGYGPTHATVSADTVVDNTSLLNR